MKKRVLIVDDSESFREILTVILQGLSRDFEIEQANDGVEAQAAVMDSKFDLILLDVNMPGENGWHVLEQIRNIDKHSQVYMVTATSVRGSVQKALEMGADGFIAKPFDCQDFEGIVERLAS